MKKTSKTTAKLIAAFLLIVAIVIAAVFVSRFKTDGKVTETASYESPTITIEQVEAHPGDEVKVPIKIAQSPGIAACRLILEYDNESLELKSLTYGEKFAENGEEPAKLTNPVPLVWSQLENVTGDELFAELTFKVSKDAEVSKVCPVKIRYVEGDLINLEEDTVDFAVDNGSIKIIK